MAFSEFYCNAATGNNLNAGDTESDTPVLSVRDMNWDGTSVFTVSAGTDLTPVTAGMFASVFDSSGDDPAVAVYIARVTAVDNGAHTVTLSTTAYSGTAPTSNASARGLIVGGVWLGPNAAVGFPLSFVTNVLTNAGGDAPRVNLKAGTAYAITTGITMANAGPIQVQGYGSTVGDLGRFTLSSSSAINIITLNAGYLVFADCLVISTASTGTGVGVLVAGSGDNSLVLRVASSGNRAHGFASSGPATAGPAVYVECEAYGNTAGNPVYAGFRLDGTSDIAIRCISHDNTYRGFYMAQWGAVLIGCIADSNGSDGFCCEVASAGKYTFLGCDAYNNTADGLQLDMSGHGTIVVQNSSFVKNGGYGINGSGAGIRIGVVTNCGFGAGTQANTSGTTTGLKSMVESGSVTYPDNVTPWVDPANGDFRINLAQAKGAGRGSFTQTAASYAGTVGYPDIGAAQHADSPRAVGFVG